MIVVIADVVVVVVSVAVAVVVDAVVVDVVVVDVVVVVEVNELAATRQTRTRNHHKSRDLLRVGLNDSRRIFFFKVVQAHPQQIT